MKSLPLDYGVPIIVLSRVREAPGRRPTPRAHTDLTHNPEIGFALSRQILEQQVRGRDLWCAGSARSLVRIDIELSPLLRPTLAPLFTRTPCIRSQMRRSSRSSSGAVHLLARTPSVRQSLLTVAFADTLIDRALSYGHRELPARPAATPRPHDRQPWRKEIV